MIRVRLRFHGSLNDFLPGTRRHVPVEQRLAPRTSVKDVIESLGPPHPEIGSILINGVLASLSAHVRDGDDISVYPIPEPVVLDEENLRFVLDTHLGALARDLRLLGIDTWYRNHAEDEALASISRAEARMLLTRDVGLLKRRVVISGYFVRSTEPDEQIREVARRFDLFRRARPFSRCLRCNTLLVPVEKAEVEDRLPPRVRQIQTEFQHCGCCDRVYWAGTHHDRMMRRIEGLRDGLR